MADPTLLWPCPHCGGRPGIHAALTAIIQTLRAMAFDQVLTGWRWLALCHAIAGLLLVHHGAAAVRVARALPGVSHDRLTRLLGERDVPTRLMAGLRQLARVWASRSRRWDATCHARRVLWLPVVCSHLGRLHVGQNPYRLMKLRPIQLRPTAQRSVRKEHLWLNHCAIP